MRAAMRLIALVIVSALTSGALAAPVGAQAPVTAAIPPAPPPTPEPPPGMTAAAVAVNVVRIPGKTLLCGAGIVAAGGVLLVTFGSQYRAAGALFREGCGGKWVIGPSDFDRDVDAPQAIFSGEPS